MKAIRIATLAAALCVGITSVAAAQGTEPPQQGQGEARRGDRMGGLLLKDVIARSQPVPNAAKIIPWYQDFTLGPPHYYAEQIRAQKKAGYDNGFQSWILWNPKSNYTVAALEPRP